ncbi:hypothetical protein P154DRAFT_617224 [Amniculicola lignicola CBS 123094]|uniref:Uncharacterized protein n=1 Tax=Amniculicola lignicola CBS 123094 TaxID=1392246 RepID=A0A6A5WPZ4_9PLEO|nr:hypothetical protein P154DRAFT_617224 [Amniculicola lignicola CBS 123094]
MVSRANKKARYARRWRRNLTIRTGSSEPRTLTQHFRREISKKFCRPIQPWRKEEWFITRLVGLQKATSPFLRLPAELRQWVLVQTASTEMIEGHDGRKLEAWIKDLKEVTWLLEQDVEVHVEPYWRAQKAKKTQPLVTGFQIAPMPTGRKAKKSKLVMARAPKGQKNKRPKKCFKCLARHLPRQPCPMAVEQPKLWKSMTKPIKLTKKPKNQNKNRIIFNDDGHAMNLNA